MVTPGDLRAIDPSDPPAASARAIPGSRAPGHALIGGRDAWFPRSHESSRGENATPRCRKRWAVMSNVELSKTPKLCVSNGGVRAGAPSRRRDLPHRQGLGSRETRKRAPRDHPGLLLLQMMILRVGPLSLQPPRATGGHCLPAAPSIRAHPQPAPTARLHYSKHQQINAGMEPAATSSTCRRSLCRSPVLWKASASTRRCDPLSKYQMR